MSFSDLRAEEEPELEQTQAPSTRRRSSIREGLQAFGKRATQISTSTASASHATLKASFILGEENILQDNASCVKTRRLVWRFLGQIPVEITFTIVVLLDFAMTCIDTDLRAVDTPLPSWITTVQLCCLGIYTCEFLAVLFVKQRGIFGDVAGRLDFFVLLAGYIELIASEVSDSAAGGLGSARIIRLLRAARMLKLFRRFGKIKELKRLMQMLASCMKTLFWSFLLLFVITTLFAIAFVEVVHPIVKQLIEDEFLDAKHHDAYGSVMKANLTIFATTIAGDSWAAIAVPVIRYSPPLAVLFMGSSLTIVYGILNLVVAVVVDTFAEQREKDEKMLAQEMEENLQADVIFFKRIFANIDEDGSGDISLDELKRGAESQAEFRSRLRVMDIDEADLKHLFEMLDEDTSGSIDADEFVTTLSRWRHESRTAARFVKYNMQHSLATQEAMMEKIGDLEKQLKYLNYAASQRAEKVETVHDRPNGMLQASNWRSVDSRDAGSTREFESVEKNTCQIQHSAEHSPAAADAAIPQVSELLRLMNDLGRKAEREYTRLAAETHSIQSLNGCDKAQVRDPYKMGFSV